MAWIKLSSWESAVGTVILQVWGRMDTGDSSVSQLLPVQRGSGWRGPLWKVSPGLSHAPFPDAKGLSNPSEVESLREKVYATLEAYTKQKYPDQPGR